MTLTLYGHCPAKKNNWRPRAGGGIRTEGAVKECIESLINQAWIGWRQLHAGCGVAAPLLEHPRLRITFHVRDRRSDRDNKLSTLLDVLQKAKVIRNDNVAHFNAELVLAPAVVAEEEKTIIEITGPRPETAQVAHP